MKVEVIATSVNPEMRGWANLVWRRQTCPVQFRLHRSDGSRGREGDLAAMVRKLDDDTDFFMLADDDDYVAPEYVEHCLSRIHSEPIYGEIPYRTYMLRRQSGLSGKTRSKLFQTFTLFRRDEADVVLRCLTKRANWADLWSLQADPVQHSPMLCIMRGMMDNPSRAITAREER